MVQVQEQLKEQRGGLSPTGSAVLREAVIWQAEEAVGGGLVEEAAEAAAEEAEEEAAAEEPEALGEEAAAAIAAAGELAGEGTGSEAPQTSPLSLNLSSMDSMPAISWKARVRLASIGAAAHPMGMPSSCLYTTPPNCTHALSSRKSTSSMMVSMLKCRHLAVSLRESFTATHCSPVSSSELRHALSTGRTPAMR